MSTILWFWVIPAIIGIVGLISLFFREFQYEITRGTVAIHAIVVLIPLLNAIPALVIIIEFFGYLRKKFKPQTDKISDWFDTPIKRWNR